ncbi:unnamed protein product [Ranitomeya imitator]|uniref:MARVEL domain-containing protein n=1 Tax=Ranitomeya imitator TaxID=111125 RepID=A0ABN9LHP6_9NEOB|nr:unnamed protein product [Ranitomeya imitator]
MQLDTRSSAPPCPPGVLFMYFLKEKNFDLNEKGVVSAHAGACQVCFSLGDALSAPSFGSCCYGKRKAAVSKMVDSGPYPSDGESRAPRKHRYEQRSSRPNTRDGRSDSQDGYTSERNPSRSHHERSQNRPRERDEYHGDRRQNRHREDRSRVHHQERDQDRSRDKRYNDGGQSRYEADRSRHRYEERDGYYRESSPGRHEERNNRHEERSRSRLDERDRHQENYVQSVDRHGLSMSKKEPEHYYPAERSFSPHGDELHELEYYEAEREGGILDCHKCKYLCTGRACCQLVEVLLNMLILICCSVSYNSTGGFTGITNLGGIYYYQFGGAYSGFSGILQMLEVILNALVLICIVASHFSLSGFSAGMASGGFGGGYYPFEGQELQEVRQLDQEFTLLRAPLIYGGLTVCLLTGTLTLAILAHGSRHLLDLSQKWLLIEAVFSTVASLGYGAAVGVFLHFALQINSTDVCKKRERLYARNGLTWMNCNLAGTDGGAVTFAIILLLLYVASVVLAARAYQEKKALQQ